MRTTITAISDADGVLSLEETICCLKSKYEDFDGVEDIPDSISTMTTMRITNGQLLRGNAAGKALDVALDFEHPFWLFPIGVASSVKTVAEQQDDGSIFMKPVTWAWGFVYSVCSITSDRIEPLFGEKRRVLDVTCKYTEDGFPTTTYVHTFASGIGPVRLYCSSPTSEDGLRLVEIRRQ